jgi:hypothetical protein
MIKMYSEEDRNDNLYQIDWPATGNNIHISCNFDRDAMTNYCIKRIDGKANDCKIRGYACRCEFRGSAKCCQLGGTSDTDIERKPNTKESKGIHTKVDARVVWLNVNWNAIGAAMSYA